MRIFLAGLAILALATPGVAQTQATGKVGDYAPASGVQVCGRDTSGKMSCFKFDSSGNQLVTDPANASFSIVVGPLVAGTDYGAQAFRAINVTCTSAGSANITLVGSGVVPVSFSSGASYQLAFALKSIDAVPTGCVFYGLK